MKDSKKFDVFFSYCSSDKVWVNRLRDALEAKGARVWIDQNEIRPGDLFAGALEHGIEQSKAVALIISKASLKSGWVKEEYYRALNLAQANEKPLQLIPVILNKVKLPGFLSTRKWVDFSDGSLFDENLAELIWGITGERIAISNENSAAIDHKRITQFVWLEKYLENLAAMLLETLRQDHYVMLSVEELLSQDNETLTAIQKALRSTFDINVVSRTTTDEKRVLREAIAPHRLVVLLGEPGIGKTTSLRSLALEQIQKVQADKNELIPVWASLGKWRDKEISAEDFLKSEFYTLMDSNQNVNNDFETLLTSGKLLFFVDGLNELPQRELERQKIPSEGNTTDYLKSPQQQFDPRENSLLLFAKISNCKFLISCRIHEYTHLPNWREFRILALDDKQLMEFVQRQIKDKSVKFDYILREQPSLRDLVRNPFYLQTLIRLVQEDWKEVPTDRFQLVEYMCRAAINREAPKRNLISEVVIKILGKDAFEVMSDGWIGSWFTVSLEIGSKGESESGDEIPVLKDSMLCAEGAGLVLRVDEQDNQIFFRYLHQLVQEAFAYIFLKSDQFKDSEYNEILALESIGDAHLKWGKIKEAEENLLRALELCPNVGVEKTRLEILLKLSRVYSAQRVAAKGLKYAELALQLLDKTKDSIELARTYHRLGALYSQLRRNKEAEKFFIMSVEMYQKCNDDAKYANEIQNGLADFYSSRQAYKIPKAIAWYQKELDTFKRIGDELGIAKCMLEMGTTFRLWGKLGASESLIKDSAAKFEKLGNKYLYALAQYRWGLLLRDFRRNAEAKLKFDEALKISQENRFRYLPYYILVYGLAWVAAYENKLQHSFEIIKEAIEIGKRQADPMFLQHAYLNLGYMNFKAKNFLDAANIWKKWHDSMDEEYRLHLGLLERFASWWACSIGIKVNTSRMSKYLTSIIWMIYNMLDELNNPNHRIGRMILRLYWMSYRY